MKKSFLSTVFMLLLMGMPLLAYATPQGVPDPGTTLSLLGVGVAAVGAYCVFWKGKGK